MNRLKLLMLAFVMCITLCACKDTAQTNDSYSLPSADQVSDQASDNQTEKNVQGCLLRKRCRTDNYQLSLKQAVMGQSWTATHFR